MSGTESKIPCQEKQAQTKGSALADDSRNDTFMRLRSALLEDRLAVLESQTENTGTDPYNSGIHRAMAKAHVWNKRSR
jgi:hypothetical protein